MRTIEVIKLRQQYKHYLQNISVLYTNKKQSKVGNMFTKYQNCLKPKTLLKKYLEYF